MGNRKKNRTTSTIWAVGINVVVFAILWYAFQAIPTPARTEPVVADSGPGGTFGQYTHLIGDDTADNTQPDEEISVAETEGDVTGDTEVTEDVETSDQPPDIVWIDEFYLDRGPALSFSPRLNPDGTFQAHPYNPDREKAPTYQDQQRQYSPDELNWPVMTPGRFSKLDLPEELRGYNLMLTVQIHLDARGNLLGEPVIVRGSGHPLVDQLTIEKIKNEATFTHASLISTGEPVPLEFPLPVFWVDPVSN